MQCANPIELRKALETTMVMQSYGLDFVPIPVKNEQHKAELLMLMQKTLDEIIEELEKEEEQ